MPKIFDEAQFSYKMIIFQNSEPEPSGIKPFVGRCHNLILWMVAHSDLYLYLRFSVNICSIFEPDIDHRLPSNVSELYISTTD